MKYFTYTYGAWSDPGDQRPENQDRILCCVGGKETETDPELVNAGLFLVADGMGGLAYGSQVSAYAAEQFEAWWREDFSQMVQNGRTSEADIKELLEQEIWDINNQIYAFKEREGCRCGSTLSVLLLYGGNYYIENLGDSRIYRFRKSRLTQLTRDQSLAAQLVREKKLAPEDVECFPQKHVLTMCLGMFPVPRSEFETGKLEEGDIFLLCSDGLFGYTKEESIENRLADFHNLRNLEQHNMENLAAWLRALIPAGEAGDNVSFIVTEITKSKFN